MWTVALLLSTGEISLPEGVPPPPAALEAAELCGRLPLALGIAGAMLRELADDWESSLVKALKSDHVCMRATESPASNPADMLPVPVSCLAPSFPL